MKIPEPVGSGGSKPTLPTPWKVAIIAIVVVVLATILYLDRFGTESYAVLTPTHIQQTFIDMDGDGDIDLVVSAEVIFNEGQPDFPQGQ